MKISLRALLASLVLAAPLVVIPSVAYSASTGVGDVTSAMRYDTSAPLGSVIAGLTGEDDDVEVITPAFTIDFFGTTYDRICVTTNGGIYPQNAGDGGCSDDYDEDVENLALTSNAPMIAALGADIDLTECEGDAARRAASNENGDGSGDGFGVPCEIYYGTTTVDGRDAYAVTWYRVSNHDDENDEDLFNTFQIVIIKASTWDNSASNYDFDIEFNFGTVQDYDDGYSAADPSRSCSSTSAGADDCRWAIGWANYAAGPPESADAYELFPNTSAVDLADGNVTALTANALNSAVAGRYTFGQRSGVTTGFSVPVLDGSAAGLNSTSTPDLGVPGIYLAVAGPVGRSVWESPVYYGSDRVAASSTYLLTVTAVRRGSVTPLTLAEGELPLDGSLQAMVRLPVLAPGTYNVRMEGQHRNGSTLQLTSVISVGASGEFTSIGPNIPVIK